MKLEGRSLPLPLGTGHDIAGPVMTTNSGKTEYKPKCLQNDGQCLTQGHKAGIHPLLNFKC